MIRLCAQVEIDATPEMVWQSATQEHTREDFLHEVQKLNQSGEIPGIELQILDWQAHKNVVIQGKMRYIKFFRMEGRLKPFGRWGERTKLTLKIQVTTRLGWIVYLLYRFIGKKHAEHWMKDSLADLKYRVEHNIPFNAPQKNPANLLSSVEIIPCKG